MHNTTAIHQLDFHQNIRPLLAHEIRNWLLAAQYTLIQLESPQDTIPMTEIESRFLRLSQRIKHMVTLSASNIPTEYSVNQNILTLFSQYKTANQTLKIINSYPNLALLTPAAYGLHLIFGTIIHNFFRYTRSNSQLTITIQVSNTSVRFQFCDNGLGVTKADLQSRMNANSGLKRAQEYVQRYGGHLHIQTNKPGCKIEIDFERSHFKI